ncbi:MAG: phycobilisome rod-core linker polypeptide [Cyanobacteriota bacterium]|jgi:Phycobilisome Linker polypeptide/CpcD/allophycocyanin linker domain|nr:phycobilisome rod-core linker polypeptide [Cyanobacteriota bacterium]
MTLLQAPALGLNAFAPVRSSERRQGWSAEECETILRAVYQQVLGHQYVMESQRLQGVESLFRNGHLNVRELVRAVATSDLYRTRFFDTCNPYRFIELNHKHLLGRAPHSKEEMLAHFTILQEQGFTAEIDSYIDSPEYQERFGTDRVPYLHGWAYSAGQQGRQFSWLSQIARGVSASAKGDGDVRRAKLGRALHQGRALPIGGSLGRVVVVSTEGPFRALISADAELPRGDQGEGLRQTPAREHRRELLGVGAGSRNSSDGAGRLATLAATGVAQNGVVRSGAYVLRVPYSRLNQALQRMNRLGARVTEVSVR